MTKFTRTIQCELKVTVNSKKDYIKIQGDELILEMIMESWSVDQWIKEQIPELKGYRFGNSKMQGDALEVRVYKP